MVSCFLALLFSQVIDMKPENVTIAAPLTIGLSGNISFFFVHSRPLRTPLVILHLKGQSPKIRAVSVLFRFRNFLAEGTAS